MKGARHEKHNLDRLLRVGRLRIEYSSGDGATGPTETQEGKVWRPRIPAVRSRPGNGWRWSESQC